jgi:isoamylase
VPDLEWFGAHLDPPDWHDPEQRTLCCQLDGSEEAFEIGDYLLFLILNAHHESRWVALPPSAHGERWYRIIDTSLPAGQDFADPGQEVLVDPGDHYIANPRSTVVLLGR